MPSRPDTRSRLLALALLAVVAAAGCARSRPQTPATVAGDPSAIERLQRDVIAATRVPGVEHAVWGIAVHSLDTGERLFELNPRTLLVPASAAKLVSVASAAEAVGWDHRYQTTVAISGPLVEVGGGSASRALQGDVLVIGTGDPSIGGRGGGDLSGWVDAFTARGITRISGRIIGDDDALEEPRPALAWAWDDLGSPTGVLYGALNYAENRLSVAVTPGAAEGRPAALSVDDAGAARPLRSRVETGPPGSESRLWPEQRPGEPFLTIAGRIPAGAPAARLQVSAGNPTLWFASALRARLIAGGIGVGGAAGDADDLDARPDRGSFSTIHVHHSPPLAEIVQPLLKDSINLYGEAVLRLNTPAGAFPTNDAALEGLHGRLASWGVPPWGQQLVDGSGLSRRDVIAPETLVLVLRRMHDRTLASPWMRALPIAGVDGSLATRMRGTAAERRVFAKTGTMSNVRALAGYAITREGEHLAFAILVNNFEGTAAQATAAVDAIAVSLASFSRQD